MAKITITIPADPTRGTKVQVEGHPGPGCKKLSEGIEQALGSVTHDTETEEFNQAEQQDGQGDQVRAQETP